MKASIWEALYMKWRNKMALTEKKVVSGKVKKPAQPTPPLKKKRMIPGKKVGKCGGSC